MILKKSWGQWGPGPPWIRYWNNWYGRWNKFPKPNQTLDSGSKLVKQWELSQIAAPRSGLTKKSPIPFYVRQRFPTSFLAAHGEKDLFYGFSHPTKPESQWPSEGRSFSWRSTHIVGSKQPLENTSCQLEIFCQGKIQPMRLIDAQKMKWKTRQCLLVFECWSEMITLTLPLHSGNRSRRREWACGWRRSECFQCHLYASSECRSGTRKWARVPRFGLKRKNAKKINHAHLGKKWVFFFFFFWFWNKLIAYRCICTSCRLVWNRSHSCTGSCPLCSHSSADMSLGIRCIHWSLKIKTTLFENGEKSFWLLCDVAKR